MLSIEEIQKQLRELTEEMENLKDNTVDDSVDYTVLSANGGRYPIEPHPLEIQAEDVHVQRSYLTLLLSMAAFDQEHLLDSLNLAHRIAFGAKYLKRGEDLADEFKVSQMCSFEQLDEYTSLFTDHQLKYILILEMMLMAGVYQKGKNKALEYISKIAVLLEIEKKDMIFLSNMAVVILTGDLDQYQCEIPNKTNLFECYLKNLKFKRQILYPVVNKEVKAFLDKSQPKTLERVKIDSDKKEYCTTYVLKEDSFSRIATIAMTAMAGIASTAEAAEANEKKIIKKTEGYSYIFRDNIEGSEFVDNPYLSGNNVSVLVDKIKNTPIGIQTHYLDAMENAKAYYIQKGGK